MWLAKENDNKLKHLGMYHLSSLTRKGGMDINMFYAQLNKKWALTKGEVLTREKENHGTWDANKRSRKYLRDSHFGNSRLATKLGLESRFGKETNHSRITRKEWGTWMWKIKK